MPIKFEFSPKPENLQEFVENAATLAKPLSDHGPVELVKANGEATVDYEGNAPVGDIKFAMGVKGNTSISVFNAANDKDSDGVFSGEKPKETVREIATNEFKKIELPSTLQFKDAATAWTKYRFEAKPLITADIDLPAGFDFKFAANKTVVFADYHHQPDSSVSTGNTFTADLGNLRFAGDVNHILGMSDGDALYYNVSGVLESKLTFTWSDSFAFAISDLSRFLGKGQSLAFEFGTSASLDISVALNDDFRLVFSKANDGRIKVAVKKAASQTIGIKLGAGLKVGFANPDQLTEALNQLFTAFVGESFSGIDNIIAKIDELIKKASFDNLSNTEKKIATLLAARLGLTGEDAPQNEVISQWENLKKKWKDIKEKVPNLIKEAVKLKAGISFKYEYLRTSVEEELAIAYLKANSLKQVHKDLMLLRLDSFLEKARENGNELVTYLRQIEKVRRHAWGFTLSLGPWKLSGEDLKEIKTVIQENEKENIKRLAINALRGYKDESGDDKHHWFVDLKADMNDFSEKLDYTKLEYGLHFKYYTSEKKITTSELRKSLDYAMLWDSLTGQGLQEQMDKLKDEIGKKGEVTAEITIGDEELRKITKTIKNLSDDEKEDYMASAFARALPYTDELKHFRSSPKNRDRFYRSLWKWAFENPNAGHSQLRNTVFNTLDDVDLAVANQEKMGQVGFTFAKQVELNNYNSAKKTFFKGIDKLYKLLFEADPGDDWDADKLNGAFKSLRDLWERRLYVRASGAFFLQIARQDPEIYRNIKTVCTVTFTKDKDSKSYLIGANTED